MQLSRQNMQNLTSRHSYKKLVIEFFFFSSLSESCWTVDQLFSIITKSKQENLSNLYHFLIQICNEYIFTAIPGSYRVRCVKKYYITCGKCCIIQMPLVTSILSSNYLKTEIFLNTWCFLKIIFTLAMYLSAYLLSFKNKFII